MENNWRLVTILAAGFVGLSYQQANPTIANVPLVAELYEHEPTRKEVQCLTCVTDMNKKHSITFESIIPRTPCGSCFQVYPKAGSNEFCLYYLPSQGKLEFSQARGYFVTVKCTDSDGKSATTNVDVRIRTNEAPIFSSKQQSACKIDAGNTNAGTGVYTTLSNQVNDPNNDPIYYSMTTSPSSDYFEIGRTDGVIRARRDLSTICQPMLVSFFVTITDNQNPPRDSRVIICEITPAPPSPTISNVNRAISIPEDKAIGSSLLPLGSLLTYSPTSPPVTFDISSVPASGVNLVQINNNGQLTLRNKLNYESTAGLRQFNLTIRPNNGQCTPKTHFLYITVLDVNDKPILRPSKYVTTVREGSIAVNPGFTVEDEDVDDSHIYSLSNPKGSTSNLDLWSIDSRTGVITSTGAYDVDKPRNHPPTATLLVTVRDRKGIKEGDATSTSTATVIINIEDINDNAPVFEKLQDTLFVMDCTALGAEIGTVVAADYDSAYKQNNVIRFQPVSNSLISITAQGKVFLRGRIPAGNTTSLSAFAVDLGTDPRSLRSDKATSVTVVSTPCPTTTTTTTSTTTTTTAPTTRIVVTVPPLPGVLSFPVVNGTPPASSVVSGSNLAWMIVAGFLGLLFLGALAFAITRYCVPYFARGGTCTAFCKRGCQCLERPAPPKRVVTPEPAHRFHQRPPNRAATPEPLTSRSIKQVEPEIPFNTVQPRNRWVYQGTTLQYEDPPSYFAAHKALAY